MTKKEALFICQEKAKYEGYITHTTILCIYDDDEQIPDELFDLICHKPKPPKSYVFHVGEHGLKALKDAAENRMFSLVAKDIEEDIDKNPLN